MDDLRFQLQDDKGNVVTCTLTAFDKLHLTKLDSMSQKDILGRKGCIRNDKGAIYAFSSDPDLVNSSKTFKLTMSSILNSIEYIKKSIYEEQEIHNKQMSRLLHNLTTLNAHNIQEIYSIIPQDIFEKKKNKVSDLSDIVKQDSKDTALALLRMAKNNAAMKVEFSVFKKLFDGNPKLKKQHHNIHRVLLNIFYPFFPDFTDKGVVVNVCDSTENAYFDYESIHVALYHLIDNAAKYIKPDSELNVSITKSRCSTKVDVVFRMCSIEIPKNEQNLIFEDGFSGELATKLGKSGSGIGMGRVKKILELNGGSITVEPDYCTKEKVMGVPYQNNDVIIHLSTKKARGQIGPL